MALTDRLDSPSPDQATATPDTPEVGRLQAWLTTQHWVTRKQILLAFAFYVVLAAAAVAAITVQGALR